MRGNCLTLEKIIVLFLLFFGLSKNIQAQLTVTPPTNPKKVEVNSGNHFGDLLYELNVQGGTPEVSGTAPNQKTRYKYEIVGASACTAPTGATHIATTLKTLPYAVSGFSSDIGRYFFTAPATVGMYYFCVKVCDFSTPEDCKIETIKIQVVPPCGGGTASPIFTASNQTTHSLAGTNPIDLSTITVTNTPTTASLKWYSDTALTQEITASTVSAGVYYAAFYDATNNCKSPLAQLEVLLDSDGDGVLDSADLDKDNDGILDAVEGCFIAGKYPIVAGEKTWQSNTSIHALHKDNMNDGTSTIDNPTKGLDGIVNAEGLTGVSAKYNIKRGSEHKGYLSSYYSRTDNNKILIRANPDNYDSSTGIPSFTGNDVMNYEINTSNVTTGYNTQVTIKQAVKITKNSTGEAGSWRFTWDGGGEATYYDEAEPNANMYPKGVPANFDINNRQIKGLDTKGTFVSGHSLTIYTLYNREAKWRVVLPIGATNIKVVKTIFNRATSTIAGLSENPADGIDNAYPMYGFIGVSGSLSGESYMESISFDINFVADKDGDGIPNCLDLDSDNDGCPDALEGGAGFIWDNLVDAQGQLLGGNGVNPVQTPTSGTYNKAVLKNLGIQVGSTGIPTDAGAGQAIGTSNNSTQKAQICIVCTASPFTTGIDLDTPIGISTLGHNTENWVTDKNAFIKLESKTLGFIPTKMTTAQRDVLTGVKGMVIWNTTTKCLELYDGNTWKCVEKGCNKL